MKKMMVLILLGVVGFAFTRVWRMSPEDEPVPVPASPQRSGNVARGYAYLTTGDYIKSGIPYNFFFLGFPKNPKNYLGRDSLNAPVSHEYTAVKAPNGEIVVAPNCLECHAQVFEDKLIVGLGNSMIDSGINRLG